MLEFFRKYRLRVLLVLLCVAALLFYSALLRYRGASRPVEVKVIAITAPLLAMVDGSVETVADLWGHYLWLIDTAKENEDLLKRTRELAAELAQSDEIRLENARLRRLLDFKDSLDRSVLAAEVISEDAGSWFRTVLIDKGSEDGLREGLPVVVAEGVVGRIIRCSAAYSRVLLVTDASSAMAVLLQRHRPRVVVRGVGDRLRLEFALRQEEILEEDLVLTSGTGGIFPKGLVVGRVTSVQRDEYGMFQQVELSPAVDFSRLEEVLVLLEQE